MLAIGAGSLFFSHVNDAGFWLVKQYFGLSVGETIKSWSVMETVISVVALIGVLMLSGGRLTSRRDDRRNERRTLSAPRRP